MELKWRVNDRSGSAEIVPGENRVIVPVRPGEVFTAAEGCLRMPPSEKMFFNGYQSWTYCPEYTVNDRIRGLSGLPGFLNRALCLDRFGDYHFVKYPARKGVFHGVSYCYFRDGERYRLLASLDERAGYTLFTYRADSGILSIERDCLGTAAVSPDFPAFELFYAEGGEEEVFGGWFDAMGIHNRAPAIKGYTSWYNRYQRISEQKILSDLDGARSVFDPGDLFQIDDGWEVFAGDWERADPKKFPNGLGKIAREIRAAGFKSGLWLAPFICERRSAVYREHPGWLLRRRGKAWKTGLNWSGSFALDLDHPEVRDYLARVFDRVLNEWGFDLVKLDFLYAAAPFAPCENEGGPAGETRAGRMIRALEFLRKLCGDKLILGCGVPLMPAFGLVDYCRIGPDMSLDWDDLPVMRLTHRERISAKHAAGNTLFRRQLNGRAFGSDPDVFFLRDRKILLSEREKEYLAAVGALFGSVWLTSDDPNTWDPGKIALFKRFARLRDAENIRVDPDTLDVSCELDGECPVFRRPR